MGSAPRAQSATPFPQKNFAFAWCVVAVSFFLSKFTSLSQSRQARHTGANHWRVLALTQANEHTVTLTKHLEHFHTCPVAGTWSAVGILTMGFFFGRPTR